MKTTKAILAMAGMAVLSAALVIFSACEKDKNIEDIDGYFDSNPYASVDRERTNPDELEIGPLTPTVTRVGEKVSLTVSGGRKPYQWSVTDSTAGTIDPVTTHVSIQGAVYTCLFVVDNTVVVKDGVGRMATKIITASGDSATFKIIPNSLTISTNAPVGYQVDFVASGGVTPYSSWQTSIPSLGNITVSGSNNQNARYTVTAVNPEETPVKITVKDSRGVIAEANLSFE